jgi:hypothetical protein
VRKYAYWISTGLVTLLYSMSVFMYSTQGENVRVLLGALGYPGYLVPVLIVAKTLGVIAILSRVKVFLSDLAYAGMFFHLMLAFSAHMNAAEYAGSVPAVVGLAAVVVSFLTQNSARAKKSPYGLEDSAGASSSARPATAA